MVKGYQGCIQWGGGGGKGEIGATYTLHFVILSPVFLFSTNLQQRLLFELFSDYFNFSFTFSVNFEEI